MSEVAVTQSRKRRRFEVVGTVDQSQVIPAADLDPRLNLRVVPPRSVNLIRQRFDDHPLTTVAGERLPPLRRFEHRVLGTEIDHQATCSGKSTRVGRGQAVRNTEVPFVIPFPVRLALGRQNLERRDGDAVQSVRRPHVPSVRLAEALDTGGPNSCLFEHLRHVQAPRPGPRQHGLASCEV